MVFYRINGGGHGWPAATQHFFDRLVALVAPRLDATGVLLRFA